MKKRILLILALALVLGFGGCGNRDGESGNSSRPGEEGGDTGQSQAEAQTADGRTVYPVTLTDQLGRRVTIEKKPETIASGYYISTSLLLALDLQDKIVGVEAKADKRAIYRLGAPALLELPGIGTAKEFDLEGCAALHPDLVIVPARLKDVIPSMEELGLTVIAINPENRELLEEAAVLLGAASGKNLLAEELLQYTADKLGILEDALAGTRQPTVYLASNSSLLSAAGSSMYQNSIIENAGGLNVAAELEGDYWREVSYEQILAWDPEYIILAADASYTVESVLEDPALADCRAVTDGNVYRFPGTVESWDSPVPGGVLGSLWLASVLHPGEYPEEEWKNAAVEFYETFYRFTPLF